MGALAHLGALLIRIFGIALAAGAAIAGYFLGMPYFDSTLGMFNEGQYGSAAGIAVATGLPAMIALILSVIFLKRSNWDDEQGAKALQSETVSPSRIEEYRNWRGSVSALLFVAGSGFLLWFSYEAVTMVEGFLIFGESSMSGTRRCNWLCWLSKTEWGKWVVMPFIGLIWWFIGNLAVGLGAAGCAWLIASTQRELAGVYPYINRIIHK